MNNVTINQEARLSEHFTLAEMCIRDILCYLLDYSEIIRNFAAEYGK